MKLYKLIYLCCLLTNSTDITSTEINIVDHLGITEENQKTITDIKSEVIKDKIDIDMDFLIHFNPFLTLLSIITFIVLLVLKKYILKNYINEKKNQRIEPIYSSFLKLILLLSVIPIISYIVIIVLDINKYIKHNSLFKSWFIYMFILLIFIISNTKGLNDFKYTYVVDFTELSTNTLQSNNIIYIFFSYNIEDKNEILKLYSYQYQDDFLKTIISKESNPQKFPNIFQYIYFILNIFSENDKIKLDEKKTTFTNEDIENILHIKKHLLTDEQRKILQKGSLMHYFEYTISPGIQGMRSIVAILFVNNLILITTYYTLKGYYHLRPMEYKEKRDYINSLKNINNISPIQVLDNDLDNNLILTKNN
jgi:predicted DNA binding protein